MEFKKICLEKKDGICLLKMNNPDSLNALSAETSSELAAAMEDIKNDGETRVVIITGEGKAFVAGADIKYMRDLNPTEAALFANLNSTIFRTMEEMKQVFIAAINGFALGGGCELALACDIRIASSRAKLGLPETSLAILPGSGGTQRLPRLIGMGKAKELIFTCDIVKADEAERLGIVNKVTEPEELMDTAYEMANKILKNGPVSIGYAKEAIQNGYELDLQQAIEYEKNLFALCFATEDQKEGMTAFVEKRPPVYKGR